MAMKEQNDIQSRLEGQRRLLAKKYRRYYNSGSFEPAKTNSLSNFESLCEQLGVQPQALLSTGADATSLDLWERRLLADALACNSLWLLKLGLGSGKTSDKRYHHLLQAS